MKSKTTLNPLLIVGQENMNETEITIDTITAKTKNAAFGSRNKSTIIKENVDKLKRPQFDDERTFNQGGYMESSREDDVGQNRQMNMQELEEKANQKLDEAEQALRTIDNMEFGDEQEQEKKSKKEVSLYHEIKNLRDTNVEEADFKDENESIGSERDYQKEGDIEELIDDLEFKDKDQMNRTILHKVSLDQNFAILKMHLSKIQSFKLHLKRNKEKKRVLQPRDEKINIRIDQLLEAKDENGNTALMLACVHAIESKKESKHDCIKLLLESGNNPNIMNKETGFTPLHWVARYGELQNVEILCEAGAKAYMVDSKGFTPIDYAGKFEHNSTIKYLIDLISRQVVIMKIMSQMKTHKDLKKDFDEKQQVERKRRLSQLKARSAQVMNSIPSQGSNKSASSMIDIDDPEQIVKLPVIIANRILIEIKDRYKDQIEIGEESKESWLDLIMELIQCQWEALGQKSIFNCIELLLCPILRSSLLFWACTMNAAEFSWNKVKALIIVIEPFPECKHALENEKTPLHGAAKAGDWKKLKMLIMNLNRRYFGNQLNGHDSGDVTKINPLSTSMIETKSLVFDQGCQDQYLRALKYHGVNYGIKKVVKMYQKLEKVQAQITASKETMKYNVDFQDKDGLTPLHYACQYVNNDCTLLLLLLSGASADVSSDSGIRPRDMIQEESIKTIFQIFYEKIDNALKDEDLSDEGKGFKEIYRSVTKKQFANNEDERTLDLDVEEHEITKTALEKQNQLSNFVCYKSLFSYYSSKVSDEQLNNFRNILEYRTWLPEICSFAMLVKFDTPQKKSLLNKSIQTLVQANFVVKMFPAVENPEVMYYIVLSLEQEDLEYEAECQEYPLKLIESHLKYKYNRKQKNLYEPFRSKEIQEIILNIVRKVLNIKELTRKKVLVDTFYMHEWYAIADINQKFSETTIWTMVKQSFIDHKPQQYHAFSAIKNYLGERWGFVYAFNYFYTTWLWIPSFFGIITYARQEIAADFSLLNFYFSVIVSVWITIFIERWKRKQNELRLVWGTLIEETDEGDSAVLHKSFKGNEEFSHWNFKVNLKDVTRLGVWFKLLNYMISLFFILFSVSSFFLTKTLAGDFSGVSNAAIIGTTNAAFKKLAYPLTILENHKLDKDFQEAFIHKLFWFQMINANVSIIYSIYSQIHGNNDPGQILNELSKLILGMVISKVGSMFASKVIAKAFQVEFMKWLYFRHVKEMATKQQKNYSNMMTSTYFSEKDLKYIQDSTDKRKIMNLFGHLKNHTGQKYEYRRLVSVFTKEGRKTVVDDEILLIDQIEINRRLHKLLDENELQEFSDIFILFSYAALYSFICPILPAIIFGYNCLIAPFSRMSHLHYLRRKEVVHQNGLGPWNDVLVYLGYASVLINSILLYWFRVQIISHILVLMNDLQLMFPVSLSNSFLSQEGYLGPSTGEEVILNDKDILDYLILLVIVEHLIIGIKVFLAEYIEDIAPWISKQQTQVLNKRDELNQRYKEIESKKEFDGLKSEIIRQKGSFAQVLLKVTGKFETVVGQYNILNEKQKNASAALVLSQPGRGSTVSSNIVSPRRGRKMQTKTTNMFNENAQDSVAQQSTLTSFFLDRFKLNINGSDLESVENILNDQLQKRLFRETFHFVERNILQKRLIRLSNSDMKVKINCAECSLRLAVLQCKGCESDFLCEKCYNELHPEGSKVLSLHPVNRLNADQTPMMVGRRHTTAITRNFFKQDLENNIETIDYDDLTTVPRWQKYEKFNIPLTDDNEFFKQIRLYFSFLKDSYIRINNTSDSNMKTDIVKLMLDQNYTLLGNQISRQMLQKFREEREKTPVENLGSINDFELDCMEGDEQFKRWEAKKGTKGGANMSTVLNGKTMFNDEDLLFLNRVAFILLNEHGPSLQFKTFIETMRIFQEGSLSQKIDLVLDFVKEGRKNQKYVHLENLIHALLVSMPQDITFSENAEHELLQIFNDNDDTNYEAIYSRYLKAEDIRSKLLQNNGAVKEILNCILQLDRSNLNCNFQQSLNENN